MNQYVAQNRLDERFRKWQKTNHNEWNQEVEILETEIDYIISEIDSFDGRIRTPRQAEAETQRRRDIEWLWKVKRRQRELIRWEREDLEWEWKLEHRQKSAARETRTGEEATGSGVKRPMEPSKKNRQHRKRTHEKSTIPEQGNSKRTNVATT